MVVCHCNAVNDLRIRDEIRAGAIDAAALRARCGAGARCGGCVRVIEQILRAESSEIGTAAVTIGAAA
jgi:bacterioferritin-associated ferredoxin